MPKLILLAMAAASAGAALAQPKIQVNGREVSFPDQPPRIRRGTVVVPIRFILEHLGAEVRWLPQGGNVFAYKGNVELILHVGRPYGTIDGRLVRTPVPIRVVNGRTLVPLRFVAEALRARVDWDRDGNTVSIHTRDESPLPSGRALPPGERPPRRRGG